MKVIPLRARDSCRVLLMYVSGPGIVFIKGQEGFRPTVYGDAGHQAIGYGHDLLPGQSYPNGINQIQANALLLEDLQPVEKEVTSLMPQCNQNQFDALCSFGYNAGVFGLKVMLAHGFSKIPDQLPKWDYSGGVVDPALTKRRAAELALFMTPC